MKPNIRAPLFLSAIALALATGASHPIVEAAAQRASDRETERRKREELERAGANPFRQGGKPGSTGPAWSTGDRERDARNVDAARAKRERKAKRMLAEAAAREAGKRTA